MLPATVRVQNVIALPFVIVTTGVSSQLLIVPVPDVLLKFAPMYDVEAPECDGNTVSLPWNQSVKPSGSLWLIIAQSGRFVMSSNPSLTTQAPLGALTPWAEADEADDLAPWAAVGDTRLLAAPAPVAAIIIAARAITAGNASSNAKRFFDCPNSLSLVSGARLSRPSTLSYHFPD